MIITLNNYIYKTHTHTHTKKKIVKLLQEVLQGYYDAFEIGEKKVRLRKGNIEGRERGCIEVQKTLDNAGGKPTRGFSLHSSQHNI